jgi:hypothetical protein
MEVAEIFRRLLVSCFYTPMINSALLYTLYRRSALIHWRHPRGWNNPGYGTWEAEKKQL